MIGTWSAISHGTSILDFNVDNCHAKTEIQSPPRHTTTIETHGAREGRSQPHQQGPRSSSCVDPKQGSKLRSNIESEVQPKRRHQWSRTSHPSPSDGNGGENTTGNLPNPKERQTPKKEYIKGREMHCKPYGTTRTSQYYPQIKGTPRSCCWVRTTTAK
jgi:hypothetical protein